MRTIVALAGAVALGGAQLASASTGPARTARRGDVQPRQAGGLTVRTSATPRVVRPGGTITFTTTVTNDAVTVRREVTICDRMPASVAHVVHTDGASIFDANACRGPAPLAPDATSVL